jgi:polyhydroxybutyrate depolymerase
MRSTNSPLWFGLSLLLSVACADEEPRKAPSSCEDNAKCVDPDREAADTDGASVDGSVATQPRDSAVDKSERDAGAGATPSAPRADAQAGPSKPSSSDASVSRSDAGASTPLPTTPGKGSAGCGVTDFAAAGPGTIDVAGTAREYIVALPQGYDPKKQYKLVYAWHGLGGTAASIARNWYGLSTRALNSTIFVAGQGLATANDGGAGWPNTSGRDVAFVKALHERMRSTYCIDEERVFSVGMSYGGIMSNTLGCQMGDVFRAIAPIAGSGPQGFGRAAPCTGQVAAWLAHGNMDTVVTFASGQSSRDHWVQANHCEAQTMPTEPSGCVAYQGCDDGQPVHWCEFAGGHTVPAFASAAIWTFFSQF